MGYLEFVTAMVKTTRNWAVIGLVWVAICQGANAYADVPKHLTVAEDLVTRLKGIDDNHYGGGNRHIDWDATPPTARSVCSSFISLLLIKAYGLTDADIAKMGSGSNPKAEDYFGAVGKGKAFERISKVRHLRAGDFLFVKYTDGHVSRNGVEDTGHVMLVASTPERTDKIGEAPVGTDVFTIEVIDSSASGHGTHDTRHIGKNKFTGGVGKGTLRIAVNPTTDEIAAYSWSDLVKSEYFSAPNRVLIGARLNLNFFQGGGSR